MRVVGGRRPRVELDGAVVRGPRQRRGRVDHEVQLGLPLPVVVVVPAPEPVGRVLGDGLVPEPRLVDAVREPVEVHRAIGEVREHRGGQDGVVPDEVALGERLRPAAAGLGGEQHLVEVGQLEGVLPQLPLPRLAEVVERGELVVRGPDPQRAARPRRRRRRLDLVVGAAALHRPGVVLRVPALDGVVVVLVEQEPLRLAAAGAAAHEHEPTAQLLPLQVEVEIARVDRLHRVLAVGHLPGPPVPHDDVATAVLPVGDHALEVEVAERVVLHVHGHALHVGIEGRALRHRPADQHPVGFESEVVVQRPGAVALHHEALAGLRRRFAA